MTRSMRILGSLALIGLIAAVLVQVAGVRAAGGSAKSGQPPFHGHTPRGPFGVSNTVSTDVGESAIHPQSLSNSSSAPSFTVADVNAYLLTTSQPEITLVQGAQLSIEKVLFVSDSEATQLMHGEDPGLPANAVVCFVLLKGPFYVQVDLPPGTPAGAPPTATEVGEVFDGHTGNLLEWGILDSIPARSPAQPSIQSPAPSVNGSSRPLAGQLSTQSFAPSISYNCQATRCYGINWWPNAVNGAYTFLNWSPGALFGAGSSIGIVRNAMWVVDKTAQHANSCYVFVSDLPTVCFVEAGIMSSIVNGSNKTQLYWADVRPDYTWFEHKGPEINTVWSTTAIDITIWRAGTISSQTSWCPIAGSEWCVDVYSEGDNKDWRDISGRGHSNTMIVSGYQVGLELYGTSGAVADNMFFEDNQWEANNGTDWHYQTNSGDPNQYAIDYPADAWWNQVPAQGNYGGDWTTCIAGAGC